MKEYRVWVDIRGGYYTTIEADNPTDAFDIAIDEADIYNCMEWDFDADVESEVENEDD